MKIHVNVHGLFHRQYIRKTFDLKIKEEDNLEKIVKQISKKIKNDLDLAFTDNNSNPVMLLNGERVELLEDAERKLGDGDELSILQALGGG